MSSFSDTDAWALGGDRGFAHWDGRDWRNVPAPDGGGTMEAIADAGPSDAWAVGRRGAPPAGKNFVTQIQHWDGVSWNIIPSPEFRGRYAALWGVAALAPDDAWAVGCDEPPPWPSTGTAKAGAASPCPSPAPGSTPR
ncbi:hypothetical protein [Actinomadura litoris]|uniref:Uncharacterized protein n=1 Tax=Actinomadura litoris TaxID=2678616 RepID=A0A7K1KU01_9ACTN|nr:hypothetical protein [Actinomadura litoris]MUN35416.1 hypothetical protein [Actinomadura litoris]